MQSAKWKEKYEKLSKSKKMSDESLNDFVIKLKLCDFASDVVKLSDSWYGFILEGKVQARFLKVIEKILIELGYDAKTIKAAMNRRVNE